MDPNTVCAVCPTCGHHRFTKVRGKGFSVIAPRRCTLCAQVYRPPTPKPLAIIGFLVGAFVVWVCTESIVLILNNALSSSANPANPIKLIVNGIGTLVGLLVIFGSIRTLKERPVIPADDKGDPSKPNHK
ncbi:MAG: hypothetical protein AAGK09_08305 [Planctomycetota bacterium]